MLFGTSHRLAKLPRNIEIKYKTGVLNVTCSYKYLGVKIDSSLNLNSYFETSYKKASGRLNLLAKLRKQVDSPTALAIYNTMVLPLFTYCNLVHLKQTDTHMKKYASFVDRAKRIVKAEPNTNLLRTINGFRKRSTCAFVRKCIDGDVCENFQDYFELINHSKNTRNNTVSIRLPAFKTEYGKRSACFMAGKIYNELPCSIRNEKSFTKFLTLLKQHHF